MKSPLKFFITLAILFFTAAMVCSLLWHSLSNYIVQTGISSSNSIPSYSIALADYYIKIGEIEKGIAEYKIAADTNGHPDQIVAASRLRQTLLRQQSLLGRLPSVIIQLLWAIYPRLYGISGLFLLTWGLLSTYKLINKSASFAILPILSPVDVHGIEKVPTLVIERMREIQWRTQRAIPIINKGIAEQLEIPSVGLSHDRKDVDIDAVIEAAWAVTSGGAILSLGDLIKSLRLWLNTPKHIISGSLYETKKSAQLHLFMHHGHTGVLERTWQINIKNAGNNFAISNLIDDIAYLLLHHFNHTLSAKDWRTLQASTNGLLYLELYITDHQDRWLTAAKISLEKALSIDPEYAVAKYNLGLVFMAMGQFDTARKLLKPMTL
jgi:tetratricopeptide (TPR) repeat protein